MRHTNLWDLGLVAAAFILAAASYPHLPELVPTHWNADGEVDGFIAKPWGPFVLPATMAFTGALLAVLPLISPRGFRMETMGRALAALRFGILSFLLVVTALALAAGTGLGVPVTRAVVAASGLLFVVLGNFMGKLRRNFFVGVRTPWTLASEEVWLRTHRLAGKTFVVAGLAVVGIGLAGGGVVSLLLVLGLASGIPVLYSYALYRRIEGFGDRTPRPPRNEGWRAALRPCATLRSICLTRLLPTGRSGTADLTAMGGSRGSLDPPVSDL